MHLFGRPDHIAAEFALRGLCASSEGAPWSLGLSDSAPGLRALPSEGWASAPSSCWKSNIKEDVRETRTEGHEKGGEERGKMGRESGPGVFVFSTVSIHSRAQLVFVE